jgi:hypothetical protein
MTWNKLLAEKRVVTEPTTKQELDDLRAVVDRNLHDAALPELSADGKFSIAYDAARGLATIAIRANGYRVKAQGGAHYNTFLALEAALGSSIAKLAAYFDSCRRKRNDLSYDTANVVTDTEVDELLKEVKQFVQTIGTWISQHHPNLA